MKKLFGIVCLAVAGLVCAAQPAGALLSQKIGEWSARAAELTADDPEVLSLHCILLEEIVTDMDKENALFAKRVASDKTADFYKLKHDFDVVYQKVLIKNDTFQRRKAAIGDIFHALAKEDLAFRDTVAALYHLDRALQYQPQHPMSLLESAKVTLALHRYEESVAFIHRVYSQEGLPEEVERKVSDFTLELYEKLYSHGDRLVKSGRSAEALEVFYALEHFCNNMPSGYCNDDYYKGLMLSREGVYESYISIAKEAERRGNIEMARKFYNYAEEYKRKN